MIDAVATTSHAFWILAALLDPHRLAEILVSITGLEFAYTQAPRSAKSTLMSVWFLTIALGNFVVAIIAPLNPFEGGDEFLFWAGITAVVAVYFVFSARRYQVQEFVEPDADPA